MNQYHTVRKRCCAHCKTEGLEFFSLGECGNRYTHTTASYHINACCLGHTTYTNLMYNCSTIAQWQCHQTPWQWKPIGSALQVAWANSKPSHMRYCLMLKCTWLQGIDHINTVFTHHHNVLLLNSDEGNDKFMLSRPTSIYI